MTYLERLDKGAAIERARQRREVFAVDEVAAIVHDVRVGGDAALGQLVARHDALEPPLLIESDELQSALETIPADDRALLERTAARIERFATAQRRAVADIDIAVPGGRAGHTRLPLARAGCYAPGGAYPLVSSVLMCGVTAGVAGCALRVLATPGPTPMMLAAAAIADFDLVLRAGGAHAIAALAYGTETVPALDVIVGPGNRWVTAAKRLVAGDVAIDMLAGPSELLVVADDVADPDWVARDLVAQAEHDADACPMLLAASDEVAAAVESALDACVAITPEPAANTVRQALANGFVTVEADRVVMLDIANRIAAEHVQLVVDGAASMASQITAAGCVFIGPGSAEVLGDYGIGPNHTLPTGGCARFQSGLSVETFLRTQTWLRVEDGDAEMVADAARLARLEGLEGHARAAEARLSRQGCGDGFPCAR